MLNRLLAASRYAVIVAVLGTLIGALALMLYEAALVVRVMFDLITAGGLSARESKALAVGLIEAVDVFLIAIAMYMISLGLYSLFVDDRLPLPRWLKVGSLDDLKAHLVSVVIAVLAVLFLREAVAWDGSREILAFGAALALIIAALTFYLASDQRPRS